MKHAVYYWMGIAAISFLLSLVIVANAGTSNYNDRGKDVCSLARANGDPKQYAACVKYGDCIFYAIRKWGRGSAKQWGWEQHAKHCERLRKGFD